MWSRITGKSNDAEDDRPTQSGRRKNDHQASKRHQSESTVSSNSARQKASRADDRDRGFTPTSTSYASTTKNPYPNTASPSVALSYSVAGKKTDEQYIPPGLVRNASLADQMPKSKSVRGERDPDHERNGKSERRRERSLSRDREQGEQERPRSRDRGDKRREKKDKREKERDQVKDRGLSRSDSGFRNEYGASRALGDFNEQVGSAGFMQFPGQYDGGFVGGPQEAPASMSVHVQDQFPGQFPLQTSEPYRPPLAVSEGGPGLAAEYYGDAGQSVSDQPGVRLQSPSLIIGAEPHLQAASAVAAPPPEPSTTGGVGAAASFFSGSFTPEPVEGPTPSQAPAGANGPSFYQQNSVTHTSNSTRPYKDHNASSAPAIPTLGAAAAGAAAGYFMSGGQSSQPQRPQHGSSAGTGLGASSPSTSQRPSSQLPSTSGSITNNSKYSKPGKNSSQPSNIPLYAAGAAGLAAAAFHNNHRPSEPSYSSAQQYSAASMVQQHRHHGPLSKFVDFFKDPEGVAQFEEYTEYIGVCRYCFAPGSSPREAPRKHHYRRRRSNEHLGSSTRVDKESRYASSDGEGRRRPKKSSWLATGVAGYGLAKVGETLFNQKNDFDDTCSVKTGYPTSTHGTHGSHSPDRRSITSRGVARRSSDTHSRRRSRSIERVEKVITRDGRVYKKDPHGSFLGGPSTTIYGPQHHSRARSRSRSRDRNSRVADVVLGAAVGSSIAAGGSRIRSRSPKKAFVRSKQRSRERSPDLPSVLRVSHPDSHYGSHRSHNSPPSAHRHKSRRKEKKGGFFNFGNGSSSSSDAGGFFGSGRAKHSRKPKAKGKDDRNADVALVGLGAAAAALALNGSRQGTKSKRIADLVAIKESKGKLGRAPHHESKYTKATMPGSEDNMWESASEDESENGDFALAYGVPARRRRSQDSLSSESSGMGLWGWRWGSKKKAKDPTRVHKQPNDNNFSTIAGAAAAGLAGTSGMSSIHNTQSHETGVSSGGNVPLQLVYPVPTSDPSRFDVTRANSIAPSSQPIMYSRPGPVPIQHPQPIAPVSPAVYTTQVPYGHSYSAPTGPPLVTQNPYQPQLPIAGDRRQMPFSVSQDVIPGSFPPGDHLPYGDAWKDAMPRRRDTSPTAPLTENLSKVTGPRRRSSLKEDSSAVRFDLTKDQKDHDSREKRRESKADEDLRLQRERRESRRQDKEDEELRIQSERRERRRTAKEEGVRAERERWEVAEQKQIEKDQKKSSKGSPSGKEKSWAAPVAAGAVVAAVGAAVAAESSKKNVERDERREKRRRERESQRNETTSERRQRSPEEASEQIYNGNDQRSSTRQQVTSAPSATSRTGTSDFQYEDYASFFTPPEISSRSKEPKEHVANANADNDITIYQTPEIITREPAGIHGSSRSPAYSYAPDELGSDHVSPSWVPKLNLIEPTPPASRASSTRGPPSPVIEPLEDIVEEENEQTPNSTTPTKVTWGQPETREFTVITPMEQRDQFIDSSQRATDSEEDVPELQDRDNSSTRKQPPPTNGAEADHEPGYYGNDLEFAATLAAGLEDTGFNPSIVIDDPVFRRRDSPPGSKKMGAAKEASVAEESSRQRPDSPRMEVEHLPRSTMPGSFDGAEEYEPKLSKKDRKKREKAAKRNAITDNTTDRYIEKASQSHDLVSAEPERLNEKPTDTFDESGDRNRSEKMISPKSDDSRQNGARESYTDSAPTSQSTFAGEGPAVALASTPRATNSTGNSHETSDDLPYITPLPEDDGNYESNEPRVIPESLDSDYDYEPKPNNRNSRSGRHLYESRSEDAPSVAATAPVSTETGNGKKHRKKSKRSSSGCDGGASVASAPAAVDDSRNSKKSSKKEKGRKGGLFGLFSKSTDNLSEANGAKETSEEATLDDFEEPKRKSKKLRDRKPSHDDEIRSLPAVDVHKFEDDEERNRSHKSREKKEKRRSSGGGIAQDSGRITQDLPAKDREFTPSEETSGAKIKGENENHDQQESVSFLDRRQKIPPSPDIPTATPKPPGRRPETDTTNLANIATYAVDDLALLEENRRTILADRERHGNVPSIPNSQPTSPFSNLGGRIRRLSEVKTVDSINAPATAASPTAVPFRWKEPPPSPGFSRSSPSTPISSLTQKSDIAHPRPKIRPRSTEFKSSTEFRPLWLVERHGPRQEPAPEEVYPSLPSSHTTSRASSVHDLDDEYLSQDPEHDVTQSYFNPVTERHGLVIDTEKAAVQSDLLDSQEPTPTASSFHPAERGETYLENDEVQPSGSVDKKVSAPDTEELTKATNSPEPELKDVDDLFPHRRQPSPSKSSHEPSPDLSSAPIEDDKPAVSTDGHDKDKISIVQKVVDMAAMIGGSAATAITASSHHDQRPELSLPETHGDQPWQNDKAPTSDIERAAVETDHFQEADYSNKKPKKVKKKDKKRSEATSSQEEANPLKPTSESSPLPSSKETAHLSVEEQKQLQEQDAQDAVDSWFAPATSKQSKKDKKGKKKVQSSRVMEQPQATRSDAVAPVEVSTAVSLTGRALEPAGTLSFDLLDDKGVKLETPRHATESTNDDRSRVSDPQDADQHTRGTLANEDVDTMAIVPQDTTTSENDLPKSSAAVKQPSVKDEWQGFGGRSKKKGKKNKKASAEPWEEHTTEPSQADVMKRADIAITSDVVKVQDDPVSPPDELASQASQPGSRDLQVLDKNLDLYAATETCGPFTLSGKKSKKSWKNAESISEPDMSLETASKVSNQVTRSPGDEQDPFEARPSRQKATVDVTLGAAAIIQTPTQDLGDFQLIKKAKKGKKGRKSLREVEDSDPVVPMLGQLKALDTEVAEPGGPDSEHIQDQLGLGTTIPRFSSIETEFEEEHRESNDAPIEVPSDPWVSPEAIPLPVNDDLDLLDALPESPSIIAVDFEPNDLTAADHEFVETEHDRSSVVAGTAKLELISPEATPLPLDDDLALPDALPIVTSLPADDDFDLLDGLPEAKPLPADNDLDLLNELPETKPLPADDDLDLLDALPESPIIAAAALDPSGIDIGEPRSGEIEHDNPFILADTVQPDIDPPQASPSAAGLHLGQLDGRHLSPVIKPADSKDERAIPFDLEHHDLLSTTDAPPDHEDSDEIPREVPLQENTAGTEDFLAFTTKKKAKKGKKSKQSPVAESGLNQTPEKRSTTSPFKTMVALDDLHAKESAEDGVIEYQGEQPLADELPSLSKKKGKKGRKQSLLAGPSKIRSHEERDLEMLPAIPQPVEEDSQARNASDKQDYEAVQEPSVEDELASFSKKKSKKGKKQKSIVQEQEPMPAVFESHKSEPSELDLQQPEPQIAEVQDLQSGTASDASIVDTLELLPKSHDQQDQIDVGIGLVSSSHQSLAVVEEHHSQDLPAPLEEQTIDGEWTRPPKKKVGKKGKNSNRADFEDVGATADIKDAKVVAEAPTATTDTAKEVQALLAETEGTLASSDPYGESVDGYEALARDVLEKPIEKDDVGEFSRGTLTKEKGKRGEFLLADDPNIDDVSRITPEATPHGSLPLSKEPVIGPSKEMASERSTEDISKRYALARTLSEPINSVDRDVALNMFEVSDVPSVIISSPELEEIQQSRAISPETAALLSRDDEKPPDALKAADIVPTPEFDSQKSSQSSSFVGSEPSTWGTYLDPIVEGQVSGFQESDSAPHADFTVLDPADRTVDISDSAEGVQESFDGLQSASGQLPTLSKKDKKKAKSRKASGADEFDSPRSEPEAILEDNDVQKDMAAANLGAPNVALSNVVADEFEGFQKSKKDKKKAKKIRTLAWDEELPMSTPENEKVPDIDRLPEGFVDDVLDFPVAAKDKVVADESEGLQKSKKAKKKAKQDRSSAEEDNIITPTLKTEPIPDVADTQKDLVNESKKSFADKEAEPITNEFVAALRTRKDKKKAKKSKTSSWEDEIVPSTPEHSESQELATAREDSPVAEATFEGPEELATQKEADFPKSKKNKKSKKTQMVSLGEESPFTTDNIDYEESFILTDDPLKEPNAGAEGTESPKLIVATQAEPVIDPSDSFSMSKKDKKKAKKKSKAMSWEDESGTVTPERSEVPQSVVTPDTIPQGLVTAAGESREVEADVDQVAAEKSVQDDITSTAAASQHTLDNIIASQAQQIAETDPETESTFSLKKSKKDKKKAKKAQAFNWDEDVAQAEGSQPIEQLFTDTDLAAPPFHLRAEESSKQSPQREVVQESGHMDFIQPFDKPSEALHVKEEDFKDKSASSEDATNREPSEAREDVLPIPTEEDRIGQRSETEHLSDFQPVENLPGAFVDDLLSIAQAHIVDDKPQDYQSPIERAFDYPKGDLATSAITHALPVEGQTEISDPKITDTADAQQFEKNNEDDDPWDVPLKKGKKGKKQRKDKLPASGIPHISEDTYISIPEGSPKIFGPTTATEQAAIVKGPSIPAGTGEILELAVFRDYENPGNEKDFKDSTPPQTTQAVAEKPEPFSRSRDIEEFDNQGVQSTAVEGTSVPQDDFSTFTTTKKSKKAKKAKEQEAAIIWEDETATQPIVNEADAGADEADNVSGGPAPIPAPFPSAHFGQQSNVREPQTEQHPQEQPTHEQYVNIPSALPEFRGTVEEPSQTMSTSDDYFSIPHGTETRQVGERDELKLPEPEQGNVDQGFSTEPPESRKLKEAIGSTDQTPDVSGQEKTLPIHEEQAAEVDWDYAPAKRGKKGKKSKRKDTEGETDNSSSGAVRVEQQSSGEATPSESKGLEGMVISAATGLGLGLITTEGLPRKDSKTEGKKGKKSRKASKRTEFDDEEAPNLIEREENDGQAQIQTLAQEQQRPIIPLQHFQDTSPLSPEIHHNARAEGASFGSQPLLSEHNINRDSAIQVSDSPVVAERLPDHRVIRDSGYQDTEVSPVVNADLEYGMKSREHKTRDAEYGMEPFERNPQSHQYEETPAGDPFAISVEVSPDYDISISRPKDEEGRSRSPLPQDDNNAPYENENRYSSNQQPRDILFGELREPSPVSSTTKDRSSVLFQSSPSTRDELAGRPPERPTHTQDPTAAEYSGHEAAKNLTNEAWSPDLPRERSPVAAADRGLHVASPTDPINQGPGSSLFGGPVGIISDISSPPRSPFSPDGSTRRRLDTITEYSPEESPLHKKGRLLSDVGSPERGVKSLRRSARPQSLSQQRVRSPPAGESTPKNLISTDDLIARLSWPPVDEDKHAVDLERSRSRNTDHSHQSNAHPGQREGERRSVSGASIRSGDSINAIIRTPEQVRSVSGQSFRSSGTPPLRRVDHRLSGDLRLANKKSEAKLAKEFEAEDLEHDIAIPSSSTYDPIKDKGKTKVRDMAGVYEGWGDVHGQSPISPTRPPSMRRRQSLQVLDLESKLDQLVSENRLLQNAKATAERGLDEATHARNSEIENFQVAIQTRDSFLSQKDTELNQLKHVLEGLQNQVAQLTEVNEGLSATKRSIDEHEQRYNQLQTEHANTHQQWQQSLIELDELRQQHSQLSAGMEDIVRHEVNVALEEKNLELRKVHDELEATKDQVRVLQRQILASKNSDDLIVARDEDYFDDQCQKLCQHVQQWVLRFSKFSDMRACYLASEIRDETVVDRIENAILDGSDVDSYLADRVKRRDVFMSVVMTMIFDYIFTRYLFGVDREQRQKLKSLQNTLSEVGRMTAVHKWRATTLTLLSRRQAFVAQRAQDTEAVMEEIYKTLATFLPPPSHLVNQIQDSLRKVISGAVDLHIEMRTQRAEYVMLPPLQPEYDTNGDLARKVYFNAALMNERSGDTSSNDALEAQHAVVRMVLFPLVVKRGDDSGIGDEEIVVCPAQVLTAKPGKEKRTVRVMSVAGSTAGARSAASLGGSDVGMENMI